MRDLTTVYVAPQYGRSEEGYVIVGWKYEVVRNNRLVTWGHGYDAPETAREAGREAAEEAAG